MTFLDEGRTLVHSVHENAIWVAEGGSLEYDLRMAGDEKRP